MLVQPIRPARRRPVRHSSRQAARFWPRKAIRAIDTATGGGALRDGLAAALPETTPPESVNALANVLSAAFDRAAIAIAAGGGAAPAYRESLGHLVNALIGGATKNPR